MAHSASGSALDHAFPSLLVMGLLLVLSVGLIAVCGWKILLLHQEEQSIGDERLLLERDRDEFLTYGSELPQLREEHRVNLEQVELLKQRQTGLQEENSELEEKRTALLNETATLNGTIAALNGQIQTLREALAKDAAELTALGPDLEKRRKEHELLLAQERNLDESIAKKRESEANLAASLAGLETRRKQAEEFLAHLEADKATYGAVQNNFTQIFAAFETMLAKSGDLTKDYAVRLEELANFKSTLDRGMASLASDMQAMASNLDAIKEDRAAHSALLKQGTQQVAQLQGALEGVTATNQKFAKIMDSIQVLDKKFQDSLTAEVKSISARASEDAETRAALSAAALSLGQSAENLRKEQQNAKDRVGELASLLANQQARLEKLNALALELEGHSGKSQETALAGIKSTATLTESAQILQGQTEKLQTRIDGVEAQGRAMESILAEERGRVEELSRLGLEIRTEVNESKRLAEDVRGALAEILALLKGQEKTQ